MLDGLERVQFQESTATEAYGQIEDPLLRNLLTRVAEGMVHAVVLVTSRFPLTDLQPLTGRGYRHVDVGNLSQPAAVALLQERGVKGDDTILAGLVENYGAHALTLDHLGGLIGQFLDGNPYRAPELSNLNDAVHDRQAFRLARLLKAYEEHLPPAELALLCRLCLLRRSVKEEHIFRFFLCTPAVHARTLREIEQLFRCVPGLAEHLEEQIHNLTTSVRATLEEALCASPISGPEEDFKADLLAVAQRVIEVPQVDFGELARLYENAVSDSPTDLRPLDETDRTALSRLNDRLEKLRERSGFQEDPDDLSPWSGTEVAPSGKQISHGFSADDLVLMKNLKCWLNHLAAKHFALLRVRELCRTYQQKWSLAGPLATLDAADIRRLLDNLVGRHLVQREGDGSYSVHPAVRDHFHRLALAEQQGAWHDILREQLVSLVQRPGQRQPQDAATLDLVEEAIYHSQAAGRSDEAHWLYRHVLGGLRHLGWKLGEMARGLRVLRSFQPCPEEWDLGWYLRALGELERAFAANSLAYFRADILLLQGRLPEVASVCESTRTAVAGFLMGKTTALPPDQLASTIPCEQLLLYLGRLERVRRAGLRDQLYRDLGWEGNRARCQLLAAEAARRQADFGCCNRLLEEAAVWILHSGSVEHLCLLHLIRGRSLRVQELLDRARQEITEGLHIARHCGLRLLHVELLCEEAELLLPISGDMLAAEKAARDAHSLASAPECQFAWGTSQAGHLLGQALAKQARVQEARQILHQTLDVRRRIGDPEAETTANLLSALPGGRVNP